MIGNQDESVWRIATEVKSTAKRNLDDKIKTVAMILKDLDNKIEVWDEADQLNDLLKDILHE